MTAAVCLLLAAMAIGTAVSGCCCPPKKNDGGRPPEWSGDSDGFYGRARFRTKQPRGPGVFVLDKVDAWPPMNAIPPHGADDSTLLLGVRTPPIIESMNIQRRTIWNGLLRDATVTVGSGNEAGSVQFPPDTGLNYGGTLFVEASSATSTPPSGSTPTPWAFPIVVTTSGGVRAGSVGTAWCCVVYGDAAPDELRGHWFVLLDDPGHDSPGCLIVGKGDCWATNSSTCVRKVIWSPNHFIRVIGTDILDPEPITEFNPPQAIIDAVTDAKTEAVHAGLR